jgi:hypothetical protein
MRDQLRAHADLLSAHLNEQKGRVSESIASLQAVLDNPNAMRPLPVPEHGDPTVGLAPPPGTEAAKADASAGSSGAIDEDADVAGDLASLAGDAPADGGDGTTTVSATGAAAPAMEASGDPTGAATSGAPGSSSASGSTGSSGVSGSSSASGSTDSSGSSGSTADGSAEPAGAAAGPTVAAEAKASDQADPAERFFGQGEPFSDERWKSGS